MTDEILALRAESNQAIAAHDAAGAVASMLPEFVTITSAGTLLQGRDAMERAFEERMRDPAFVRFERMPIHVGILGDIAMERGRWLGLWRDRQVGGCYLSRWEKSAAGWKLKAEHYVPADASDACGDTAG